MTKIIHTLFGLSGSEWILLAQAHLDDSEKEAVFDQIAKMCMSTPINATMTGYARPEPQSFRFGNVVIRNHFDAYRIK